MTQAPRPHPSSSAADSRSPEHAFRAAPLAEQPRILLVVLVVAAQGSRAPPCAYEHAKRFAVAGGDPVNGGDPSGTTPNCQWWDLVCQGAGLIDAGSEATNGVLNWLKNSVNGAVCQNLGGGGGLLSGLIDSVAGCGPDRNVAAPALYCTISIGATTYGPYNWGNLDTLLDHFGRHGPDFGSQSAEEYAQQASEFLEQMVQDGEIKIAKNGVIRVWDPETQTFASYNPDGTTKTFFIPDEGDPYWWKQVGEIPWFGGE